MRIFIDVNTNFNAGNKRFYKAVLRLIVNHEEK